ncbi:hypothetical protein AVEN_41038-1 [Araneus ventricosus]|uniref:Tc1-like transposase DDE domain-containing protein n=1 Tax=Araneus ventricosus TaxID=182803 RepID=A0A4Y2CLM9_ARAVE|nr:hypothetical protein AVEN_41038-1 [Araneus ventricosus]
MRRKWYGQEEDDIEIDNGFRECIGMVKSRSPEEILDAFQDDSDRDGCVRNLSYHLHPFMSIVHSDEFGQFQQDSATPHTSRVATKWLQEHSSDFRHFHCPLKSPDINIIEPIWVALQCAVQKRFPPPGTPMDLPTTLQDTFRH